MSAIAQGKENAANIKVGDRILVKHYTMDNEGDRETLTWLGKERALGISRTKTGAGVTVARVLDVQAVMVTGGRRNKRVYNIITTEGVLENNAPIQTMIMAPEDAAGIKRAHAEALELDKVYEAYPVAEEAAEAPAAEVPFFQAKAEVEAILADANATEEAPKSEVDRLREEFTTTALYVPQRRLAIRLRLAQLSATVYPDRFETQEEYEVDRLRARHAATNLPEERDRIVAKLANLGTVVHPEGSPAYVQYVKDLRAALADPRAWDFLEV